MNEAIIIFYSYSGNTAQVAEFLKKGLDKDYSTQLLRLEALDETDSFFKQAGRAFMKKKALINEKIPFDLEKYALAAFGTPVWAFGMAPALRAYLEKCSGLKNKKVIIFTTYGSGAGKNKCMNELVKIAKDKGALSVRTFDVQQIRVKNSELVENKINEALKNE